jgi:hypothetical protein
MSEEAFVRLPLKALRGEPHGGNAHFVSTGLK